MKIAVQFNKGFTLIEIMVAITVTVVGVAGIYGLVPHIIKTVSYNYNRFIASQLASEAIEIVRNVRDSNWLEGGANTWDEGLQPNCQFICCEVDYLALSQIIAGQQDPVFSAAAGTAPPCDSTDFPAAGARFLTTSASGFYSYSGANQTIFKRFVAITPVGLNQLTINVTVLWDGGNEALTVSEELYNWR